MGGRIKGVVFDLNGTLVDSSAVLLEAWVRTFEENGFRVNRAVLDGLLGASPTRIIREIAGNVNDQLFERLEEDFNRNFEGQIPLIKPYPDAADALSVLKREGIRVGVVSSYSSSALQAVVAKSGLMRLIDSFVGGDEVVLGKPDPQIYSEAFRRIGVAPAMGAVVGFSDYDALAAKKLGALAIVVSRGRSGVRLADLVFNDLSEAVFEILNS